MYSIQFILSITKEIYKHNNKSWHKENTNESKGYLILPRSSVKQVQNFRIEVNLIFCYDLLFTELHQRNQSCISKITKSISNKSEPSSKRNKKKVKQSIDLYVSQRWTKVDFATPCLEGPWCGWHRECHPSRVGYQWPISEQVCFPLKSPRPLLCFYLSSCSLLLL